MKYGNKKAGRDARASEIVSACFFVDQTLEVTMTNVSQPVFEFEFFSAKDFDNLFAAQGGGRVALSGQDALEMVRLEELEELMGSSNTYSSSRWEEEVEPFMIQYGIGIGSECEFNKSFDRFLVGEIISPTRIQDTDGFLWERTPGDSWEPEIGWEAYIEFKKPQGWEF